MNIRNIKYLEKRRLIPKINILTVIALLIWFALSMGCGSSGGSEGNSNEEPSEPKLGVVITSIGTDDCPNVNVTVSITDENNLLIEDDPALNVQLYEDGVEQTNNYSVEWMGDMPSPITVVFAMDYSGSMSDSREEMENGVRGFIAAMKNTDKAAIIKFSHTPQLMVGLTSDKTALYNAVDEMPSNIDNETNIYDSVFNAVGVLAGVEEPSAVILFTDGKHYPGDYQVYHTLEEVVDYAIQQNVKVFSIAYDLIDDFEIRYISEETGGIFFEVMEPSIIDDVFMALFDLLDKQYLIVYTCTATDGLEHSIQIFAVYNSIAGESTIQNYISCTMP